MSLRVHAFLYYIAPWVASRMSHPEVIRSHVPIFMARIIRRLRIASEAGVAKTIWETLAIKGYLAEFAFHQSSTSHDQPSAEHFASLGTSRITFWGLGAPLFLLQYRSLFTCMIFGNMICHRSCSLSAIAENNRSFLWIDSIWKTLEAISTLDSAWLDFWLLYSTF